MYKCQQIDKSKDEKKRPKIYKRQQIDRNKDKKRLNLTNYDNNRYISFLFLSKVSNYSSNLGEKTKSLVYLISI